MIYYDEDFIVNELKTMFKKLVRTKSFHRLPNQRAQFERYIEYISVMFEVSRSGLLHRTKDILLPNTFPDSIPYSLYYDIEKCLMEQIINNNFDIYRSKQRNLIVDRLKNP